MSRGRLLSPEEVHIGQAVIVAPQGAERGVGLGPFRDGPAQMTDSLHAAARRGAVLIYAPPDPAPEPVSSEPDADPPSIEEP